MLKKNNPSTAKRHQSPTGGRRARCGRRKGRPGERKEGLSKKEKKNGKVGRLPRKKGGGGSIRDAALEVEGKIMKKKT